MPTHWPRHCKTKERESVKGLDESRLKLSCCGPLRNLLSNKGVQFFLFSFLTQKSYIFKFFWLKDFTKEWTATNSSFHFIHFGIIVHSPRTVSASHIYCGLLTQCEFLASGGKQTTLLIFIDLYPQTKLIEESHLHLYAFPNPTCLKPIQTRLSLTKAAPPN